MLNNADISVSKIQQEGLLLHIERLSGDSLYVLFLGDESGRLYPGEDRAFNCKYLKVLIQNSLYKLRE